MRIYIYIYITMFCMFYVYFFNVFFFFNLYLYNTALSVLFCANKNIIISSIKKTYLIYYSMHHVMVQAK